MQTTKIYENTTNKPMDVLGVGIIQPHDRISITAEFHAPVNLQNYPGLVDVLAFEAEGNVIGEPSDSGPSAPSTPSIEGSLEANKIEGEQNA